MKSLPGPASPRSTGSRSPTRGRDRWRLAPAPAGRRLAVLVLLSAGVCAGARPAWCNGDGFFQSKEIPGNPEFVVFGSVKYEKGGHLRNAVVRVYVQEHMLDYSTTTDVLGRFRTQDIGRAIKELGYEVDPQLISVTVEYPGYHVTRREYRGKYRQNKGAIEVNFRMQRNGKSP